MARINDNFTLRAPVPIDDKKGWWDDSTGEWKPFNDVQHALDTVVYYRYRTLTLPVVSGGDVVEYWFKDGVEDSDFVQKSSAVDLSNYYTKTELQTSGDAQVHWDNLTNVPSIQTPLTFENGLREDGGVVKLGLDLVGGVDGLLTEPTYLVNGDVGSGNYSATVLNNSTIAFELHISGLESALQLSGTGIQITDNINQIGAGDIADYSANKTQYSYVTLKMLNEVAGDIPNLTGYATEQWVLDQNYLDSVGWDDISGNQSSVEVGGFANSVGYLTLSTLPPYPVIPTHTSSFVNDGEDGTNPFITLLDLPELADVAYSGDFDDLLNVPDLATETWVLAQNYITGITWSDITGSQSVIGNAGFNNTANYITLAQVPAQVQTDWNATTGLAQILNRPTLATVATTGDYNDLINPPTIPDLTGYATETWVTSQGYLTSVSSSWSGSTGTLTIDGTPLSIDGRYMLRGNTITSGYGITASADFSGPVSVELNTTVVDNRYLRKDVNDSNGANTLTLGGLISGNAEFTESVTLGSVGTGTGDEVLLYGPGGIIQRKTLTVQGDFGIANSGGTKQFDVDLGTNLRFAGTGDTVVSFNSSTNTITINSVPGQGGGGVITSVFGRTGPAILAQTGDYNTTLVNEGTNLYFTEPRVLGTDLAGFTVGSNASIAAADTILQAFGKTQGQINARVPTSRTISISGTSGNITVGGGTTQNLGSNAAWTINLPNKGTAGTYTKVTTDAQGRVASGGSLVAGDLPSSVFQDLSTSSTDFGLINISGGSGARLSSISASGTYSDAQGMVDAMTGTVSGLMYYSHTTGATGFSSEVGAGIMSWRYSGTTAKSGFLIDRPTTVNDKLYYANIAGDGVLRSWQTFASESWVLSQIATVPTNYVTTNTAQFASLTGAKVWDAHHGWRPLSQVGIMQAGIDIGFTSGNGVFIRGGQLNSATQSFILRGYAVSGVQLDLNEGAINIASSSLILSNGSPVLTASTNTIVSAPSTGAIYLRPNGAGSSTGQSILFSDGRIETTGHIDIPTGTNGYNIGGVPILGSASNYSLLSSPATSGIVYIYPNGRSSATGRSIFTPTSTTIGTLTGTGTQMVTVNPGGVLGRQSIPTSANNGTLTLNTGTGLSGSASFSANQSSNASFTVAAASGYVIPTTSQRNNWNTAYGWGDHSTFGYWHQNGNFANQVYSGDVVDANTIHPNGGFSFSYSASSWASNLAFNEYGGLLTFRGSSSGGGPRGRLQIQYGLGHSSENQSRIAFRTEYGAPGGNWRAWKELWHSGNFNPSDYQTTITGAATTIVSSNLTANRALISNGSGKVAVSAVTSTELSRLDGVTSNIQTQLNGKENTFSKNSAFNKNFGTSAGTVAQGNDSRINNGQTAFGWGDFRDYGLGKTGQGVAISNMDNANSLGAGLYSISTTSTGSPFLGSSGSFLHLRSNVGGANGSTQFAMLGNNTATPRAFIRMSHGTTGEFTDWSELWTSGNLANGTTSQYIRGNGTLATFPSIPSVGNGTLTMSTGAGLSGSDTFTANQSSNTTFTVSLLEATSSTIGGIKIYTNVDQPVAANAVTTTANRTYGIQLSSAGHAVVNVPWSNTNTTYSAGNGLSLSGTTFSLTAINAGSATIGAVRYNGTTKTTGSWYGGTSDPTASTRLNFDGIIYASTFRGSGASSDIRLKDNILPITDPLGKLSQLGGYSFRWKDGVSGYKGNDYGLIAQEVEKVLPYAIGNIGKYKTIKQENQLIGLLVAGVNELTKENKMLRERVEALENGVS